MNKVNQICVMAEHFRSVDEYKTFVGELVNSLLKIGYTMVIKTELGAREQTIIEFEYADKEFGCAYPYWLLPEEEESVEYNKEA